MTGRVRPRSKGQSMARVSINQKRPPVIGMSIKLMRKIKKKLLRSMAMNLMNVLCAATVLTDRNVLSNQELDKIKGSFWGMAAGDALAMPVHWYKITS